MTTTPSQDRVIEALSNEHGNVFVLPFGRDGIVLAAGWADDQDGGYRTSPWMYVYAGGHASPATAEEIREALFEADAQSAQIAPDRVRS